LGGQGNRAQRQRYTQKKKPRRKTELCFHSRGKPDNIRGSTWEITSWNRACPFMSQHSLSFCKQNVRKEREFTGSHLYTWLVFWNRKDNQDRLEKGERMSVCTVSFRWMRADAADEEPPRTTKLLCVNSFEQKS